jgi:hypothetical protein
LTTLPDLEIDTAAAPLSLYFGSSQDEIALREGDLAVTYAQNRLIHDADSHLMELDGCLDEWIDPKFRDAFHALPIYQWKLTPAGWADPFRRKHDDPEFRAGDAENLK